MTRNPAHDSNKTLQIALVGVRPADQVMLKGYMRVILRLATGLEWVSANHPTVDFYIVNQEFAQADSVKKLLTTQPNAAVLYVQRDEKAGGMSGDVLTLPLKELDQLKYWLSQHIDSVRDDYHPLSDSPTQGIPPQDIDIPSLTQAITPTMQSRMTLDEIIASRANAPASSQIMSQTNSFATPQPQMHQTHTTSGSSDHLLALFRQFHTTGDSIFSIAHDGELIAYVHPTRQRIWVVKDIPVFTPDLKIMPNNHQPMLDAQPSEDLVQWLWAKAYDMPLADINALAKDKVAYHLTSWVKPHKAEDSHDMLKIQCVLEAREATLDQVMQIAHTSRETTLRTIAALVASGLMTQAVYTQLKDMPSLDTVLDTIPVQTQTSQPTLAASSPAQSIPSSVSPSPLPASALVMPTAAPKKADDGMKGFLSKLRRKLGL